MVLTLHAGIHTEKCFPPIPSLFKKMDCCSFFFSAIRWILICMPFVEMNAIGFFVHLTVWSWNNMTNLSQITQSMTATLLYSVKKFTIRFTLKLNFGEKKGKMMHVGGISKIAIPPSPLSLSQPGPWFYNYNSSRVTHVFWPFLIHSCSKVCRYTKGDYLVFQKITVSSSVVWFL